MRTAIAQLTVPVILAAALVAGNAGSAAAEVNFNVNLGPPPIVYSQPPEVVVVPGSDIYFVPGYNFDLFYYSGFWWSPRGDRWYRARSYNGPWRMIGPRAVPPPLYRVPRDYRHVYVRERHIPYGQWKKEHRELKREEKEERKEFRREQKEHDRGEHRGWR